MTWPGIIIVWLRWKASYCSIGLQMNVHTRLMSAKQLNIGWKFVQLVTASRPFPEPTGGENNDVGLWLAIWSLANNSWNDLERSLKVIIDHVVRWITYNFLFVFHSNYGSVLLHFRNIVSYWSKIVNFVSIHTYIHTYIRALLKWWQNASSWQ